MPFSRLTHLSFLILLLSCKLVFANTLQQAPFKPDSGTIAVNCGLLIDGLSKKAQTNKTVVITKGRITKVIDSSAFSGDSLDLSKHSCLPGLIDTHTHMAEPLGTEDLAYFYDIRDEDILNSWIDNSRKTMDAGFTSVRNLGTYVGWSARELKEQINKGKIIGPRMQIAGYYLTKPAGGGDLVIPGYDEHKIPKRVRMGVSKNINEYRHNAQQAVEGGADVLKVIASGAVLAFGGVPGSPEMTYEEIKAIVEVGHKAGVKITAHAHGAQSIKDAIRAGVDSIEHASLADDEAIAMAASKQIAFSMDVYNGDYIASAGVEQGWPDEFIRKNNETTEAQRQVFTKAYRAGIPIIYGTDSGVYPHGYNARQFVIMVERGMSAMDAIKSATSRAAHYLGWSEDVGALTPKRYGDLIAVRGNPLVDVSLLQKVDVVIKGGLIFKLQP